MNTNFLKDIDVKKIAYLLGAAIVAYWLFKNIKKTIAEQNNSLQNELSKAETQAAILNSATISKARALQLADQIKGAWGVVNDDEAAVYAAFNELENEADVYLLMSVYSFNPWGSKTENLQTSITYRMNKNERQKINDILASKGIDITF